MHNGTKGQDKENRSASPLLVSLGIWFATLCWGGAYVAARFLLHPERAALVALSPTMLATLRFSIASLFFVVPLGQAIWRRQVSGRDLLFMALLGQLTFSLYYWLQYIGIQQTNAGISSILGVGLIPIFTTLLAQFLGEEQISLMLLIVLLSGFVGVALVVLQAPLRFALQSGFLLGALCLIANTFFFALYTNLSRRWMRDIPPIVMTGGTMISGAIGLMLVSLFDPTSHWVKVCFLTLSQWLALLFLALGCSVLAYFAYNVALSQRDASRVAVYFYFEPIIAIVLGILLLGEQLTWQTVVGTAIIGGAVFAINRIKQPA